ncbi:MAG: hypothetical protein H8E40_11110 [Chloroflexi bacterium]|nr:hypothetical protein [Chloroflexota bacterium]
MPYLRHIIRVFVASPRDVDPERENLKRVIEELNKNWGRKGVNLEMLDWRDCFTPWLGQPPERTLLEQLPVSSWDLFIGVIWSRFGTPTGDFHPDTGQPFESGTEQEFTLAYECYQELGKPKMLLYRCKRPIPLDILDPDQYKQVKKFFKRFDSGEYYGACVLYSEVEDFTTHVRRHLTDYLMDFWESQSSETKEGTATRPTLYEADLNYVHRFIGDAMTSGIGIHSILNIYAITGSGKSAFLHKVREDFQRKLPTTLVRVTDFYRGKQKDGYTLDNILRCVITDLQNGLPAWARLDPDVTKLAVLVDQLDLATHYAAENDKVALILVDDYDRLPSGTKMLFDEAVLCRLAKEPRQAIVVLTSEQELAFTDHLDLKIRLETRPLSRLTQEDIETIAPKYTTLAGEILEWTGGLSELVESLIRELNGRGIGTVEEYRAQKRELITGAYREHVNQVVFGDLPEAARQAMAILSLLRRFDVSTLRGVLPETIPSFKSYTTRQYLELIDQLGSRVKWRDQGGYVLDDNLRTILANYEQTYEPSTCKEVHRVTGRMYEEWLQERYHSYYLQEMLYHRIALGIFLPEDDSSSLVQQANDVLLKYVEGKRTPGPCEDIDELHILNESLERDEDLKEFISLEVREAIKAREASLASR